jgi:hypothetical protein
MHAVAQEMYVRVLAHFATWLLKNNLLNNTRKNAQKWRFADDNYDDASFAWLSFKGFHQNVAVCNTQ